MLNDYYIEESPSNRAGCKSCGINIKKGDLRVKKFLGNRFGHSEYSYLCAVCGQSELKDEIVDIHKQIKYAKDEIIRLKRFIKNGKNTKSNVREF